MRRVWNGVWAVCVIMGFVACNDMFSAKEANEAKEEKETLKEVKEPSLTYDDKAEIHHLLDQILSYYAPMKEDTQSFLPQDSQENIKGYELVSVAEKE